MLLHRVASAGGVCCLRTVPLALLLMHQVPLLDHSPVTLALLLIYLRGGGLMEMELTQPLAHHLQVPVLDHPPVPLLDHPPVPLAHPQLPTVSQKFLPC